MGETQNFVMLGGSTRLVSENYYLKAFGGGLTKVGFRKQCDNLRVPMWEIGNERWVDLLMFELCLAVAMRPGSQVLLAPGCSSMKAKAPGRRKVTLKELKENAQEAAEYLFQAKQIHGAKVTKEDRKMLQKLVSRIQRMQDDDEDG